MRAMYLLAGLLVGAVVQAGAQSFLTTCQGDSCGVVKGPYVPGPHYEGSLTKPNYIMAVAAHDENGNARLIRTDANGYVICAVPQ